MKIPILEDMIMDFTEKSVLDNIADRSHYVFTTVLLFFFSALMTGKLIFGSPVRCMAPAEFGGQWVKYVDEFCFSTNTFINTTGGYSVKDGGKIMNIGYYQWVPYFFLAQAASFYLPHMLWTHLAQTVSDIDFESVVKLAQRIRHEQDLKKREIKLKRAAAYLNRVNLYREKCCITRGLGSFGCYAYVIVKALNLLNVAVQFYALAFFVGQGKLGWGFKLVRDIMAGKPWDHGGYFPRVAYCNFSQMSDVGRPKDRIAQCALMVNMINEKLFAFVYFWYVALFLFTLADLAWSVVYYVLGYGRVKLGKNYLKLLDVVDSDELRTELDVRRFIYHTLGHDGLLLFHFIGNHAGDLVAGEIACKYYVKSRNDPQGLLDEGELADDEGDDDEKKDGGKDDKDKK